MWSREELKSRAKIAFKRNYWKCVLVAFILSILSSSGAANTTSNLDTEVKSIIVIAGVIAIFSVIIGIFVFSPLEIGGCYFFTNSMN